MSQEAFGVKELCWWLFASFSPLSLSPSLSLSLWFYVTVKYNTSSYRQDRGSILLAWLIYVCFKDTFLNRVLGKKKISCGLFYLLVRYSEVAGMLFEAPTPISFSVLLLILFPFFCPFCLWALVIQFFCTLHLYRGLCNIIIRTLQWLV